MQPIERIEKAIIPEDLFGLDPNELKINYRNLVKSIHPDKYEDKPEVIKKRFTALFQKVQSLKITADNKIKSGTYGIDLDKVKVEFEPTDIKTKRHTYTLLHSLPNADICDVYKCKNEKGEKLIFKSSRNQSDNDLVLNEIDSIKYIEKHSDSLYNQFYPKIIDSFKIKDASKLQRQVVVLIDYREKGYISLLEVRDKFKDDLNPRHIVWIFKRMLMGLGYLHNQSMTHGAILPQHILVHPVDHSIKIIDWSYLVKGQSKIKAISSDYKAFYPIEVLKKRQLGGYTDIYMAAKTMQYLIKGNERVPIGLINFLKYCTIPGPSHRPLDAWLLHEEFDKEMTEIFGKPKYIELK